MGLFNTIGGPIFGYIIDFTVYKRLVLGVALGAVAASWLGLLSASTPMNVGMLMALNGFMTAAFPPVSLLPTAASGYGPMAVTLPYLTSLIALAPQGDERHFTRRRRP